MIKTERELRLKLKVLFSNQEVSDSNVHTLDNAAHSTTTKNSLGALRDVSPASEDTENRDTSTPTAVNPSDTKTKKTAQQKQT